MHLLQLVGDEDLMTENIEKDNQLRIFISYARADDEPFVKQLYQDLTDRGFPRPAMIATGGALSDY